jgi:fatty acid desaturase
VGNRGSDLTWNEVHHAMVPLLKADNRTNFAYLLADYTVLGVALAAGAFMYSAWSAGRLPTAGFVPLAGLGMLVIAAVQHRFSGLGHEAGHYVLFKNKWANELVSDIFCMFPLMAMTQRFRVSHLDHHRYVNDPVRDPDRVRLTSRPADHFPMSRGHFWSRYVLEALWPPSLLGYLFGQAKNANVAGTTPMKTLYRFRVGRCMRGAFWLSMLTAVHALQSWPLFFLFWVAPLLTFYPFLMQLREIAHHSNAPDDGDFSNSRIFRVNPLVAWAIFPYGQDFHLTHHLFAMLPHYRIAEAHALLLRYPPYREGVVVCDGYFFRRIGATGGTVLDVLAERREAEHPVAADSA